MSGTGLSRSVRALLRVLPAERRGRALEDLEEVRARVSSARGAAAARRRCAREAVLIVAWSAWDAVRRRFERGPWNRGGESGVLGDLVQDGWFGMRALRRRPGFSLITIGVLGLGVGASVTIFTLADRLFVRAPAGVRSPSELVSVFRSWGVPDAGGSLSYPDYLDYRDGTRALAGLAAFSSRAIAATARAGRSSVPVRVLPVSDNYFGVLGVSPALGRFFRPEENRTTGTHPVAVVSWGFWRDVVIGQGAGIGSDVLLNGKRFTVIGVTAAPFAGLSPGAPPVQVYIPILMRDAVAPSPDSAWRERLANQRDRWLGVVGRTRPGVDVAGVQAELAGIAARIRDTYGGDPNESVLVSDQFRWNPGTRASLARLTRLLGVAVSLLLAIAAANVAILLLARASTRDRELGIRAALGAARGRIARQLLTESLLIGAAGGVLGLLLCAGAARAAAALLPVRISVPALPDARVLLFALAVSLITSLLVGIAPASRAGDRDVLGLIQGRGRHAGGGRARDVLVVLQVALSVVLVTAATLFARSLLAARSLEPGFDDRGVLLVGVDLANHGYDAERGRVFLNEATERLSALPGVAVASITRQVPFRGDWTTDLTEWPGADFAGGRDTLTVGLNVIGPGYFEAMGIAILRGRGFAPSDDRDAAPVVIANQTFVQQAFGGADPVGRTARLREDWPPMLVVGVAKDARYYQLDERPTPQLYAPVQQFYQAQVNFLIRTNGQPSALVGPVRRALLALDPTIALDPIETLASIRAEQIARHRAAATIVGTTGLIALLLACAGLYGVMAWRVTRRGRELGVRMALGASRRTLAANVLREGIRLAGIGVAIGLPAALLLARLVESLLFGVPPRDPVSFALAPIVLFVVAVGALLVPARRAMRADPLVAMRVD